MQDMIYTILNAVANEEEGTAIRDSEMHSKINLSIHFMAILSNQLTLCERKSIKDNQRFVCILAKCEN